MVNMTDVLARLDPKTRKRLQMAREVKVEKQLTPSVGLNLALKGGLAYGRQVLIWGNKSAGKSSICLQLIADAQKSGKSCAWIDAEKTFDPEWAERLGVDLDNLIVVQHVGIAEITNECVELVKAGVDIIVVDSISAILPSSYWDDEEMKDFEKTGQIGTSAKDLGKMSNMILGANDNSMLILISQQTTMITPTYAKLDAMGGNKIRHNSSTIIKLFATESADKAKKEKIRVGDNLIETIVGRPVTWEVQFNKTGPMGPRGTYDFYFDGTNKLGVNRESELAELGILYGLVVKAGAWYKLGAETFQGKDNLTKHLTDNPDAAKELENAIYELFRNDPSRSAELTAPPAEGEETE
jgi:recombination protein RecA